MNTVPLPRNLNIETVGGVLDRAVKHAHAGQKKAVGLAFDFQSLHFVDPAGAVCLANLIAYLSSVGISCEFVNHNMRSKANEYLDSSGFFSEFLGQNIFDNIPKKATTVPFFRFNGSEYMGYLYGDLAPWIAGTVRLSTDTLQTIRTCLEEVFHNIEYHSGVNSGFTVSQFFPEKKQIKIAISDFGIGIPGRVRTLLADLDDCEALKKACEEGFTTKTNVRNRGAGLALLIRYVVQRNGGRVDIRSGRGKLSATPGKDRVFITIGNEDWTYPGALVQVTLRTDTLEKLDSDVEPEVFKW